MKPRELENLGVPRGRIMKLALELVGVAARGRIKKDELRSRLAVVVADPAAHVSDPQFGELARQLAANQRPKTLTPTLVRGSLGERGRAPRESPAPWRQWGEDLEPQSVQQMAAACELPVSVVGALMPDCHVGYGLPIGGVLATDNAVIPYAVGVDIACRMKLTVLDVPGGARMLRSEPDRLINVLKRETLFGVGGRFHKPHDHPVMDQDWSITPVTAHNKDKAWTQLGTSGSGNHFVEFGTLTLEQDDLGLKAGTYLALLSHSGSRGTGAAVADYYSRLAMEKHPELAPHLKRLAWLELDSQEGQEYWAAMNLMGQYAAANHALIHRKVARGLDCNVILDVENHHNFAWKEVHADPRTGERGEMIVHRKGATPAGIGVLGIIPGSMATPGYLVRGKGSAASLESASHGAGRVMSRTQARRTFTWSAVKKQLAERGVTLLSAGLDEVPGVYKDIEVVMSQQRDLVEVVARFDPRIVRMAEAGERAED